MQRWATTVAMAALLGSLAPACGGGGQGGGPGPIRVASPAFVEGGDIPERYSCEGDNVSPPLSWSEVPDGTAELAVVVSDPDAPGGTFFHWVVVGLDGSRRELAEGGVPDEAVIGRASSDNATYIGMCPPDGTSHLYEFAVYALTRRLDLPPGVAPAEALAAIEGVKVAEGRLRARFGR